MLDKNMKNLAVAFAALAYAAVCCGAESPHVALGAPTGGSYVESKVREGYAVGYSLRHCQPLWVQYRLTRENVLSASKVARSDNFRPDPDFPCTYSLMRDYSQSGYDRGHLAPAEDMRYSARAESESFLMSNMSPQISGFNRGVWKALERQIRRFANDEGAIVVVTGPVVKEFGGRKLGEKMTVPDMFYKVVYSEKGGGKMIAFLIPHSSASGSIKDYVCTVMSVEEKTGLKFFTNLPRDVQARLKTKSSPADWNVK